MLFHETKREEEEEEERVKKLRRRRIETRVLFLFGFSLSILCVFVSSSEERLTIFEHFYHVTRADFFSVF